MLLLDSDMEVTPGSLGPDLPWPGVRGIIRSAAPSAGTDHVLDPSRAEARLQYEQLHPGGGVLSRVPRRSDLTYCHLLPVLDRYLASGHRVLDIGCGAGAVSLYAADRGAEVLGIDISENAVASCRESARRLGLDGRAEFRALDFPSVVPPGPFGMVVCFEVLEHLPNDREAVGMIRGLLAPGGVALFSVPSARAPVHRLRMRLRGRDAFDIEAGHLRRYTAGELAALLTEEGLAMLEVRRTEGLLRNALYVTATGRFLLRFVRSFVKGIVTVVDNASVGLFGESQIIVATRRQADE
ncbi:MAG: class I SAM-dependent methyltransferase [Armatimonadetes bacterium]|nr:class I SAM-dependent methyltransferase [Armatimonadota bacterium]